MGVEAASDAEDDQIRGDLKTTMGLISRLDNLNEEVTRLKINLEQKEKPLNPQPAGEAEVQQAAPPIAAVAAHDEPAAKKRKMSHESEVTVTLRSAKADIKKEEGVPKKAKQVQWAPEGYYFVKAVRSLSAPPYFIVG